MSELQLIGELSVVVASVSVVIGIVLFYLEYRRSRLDRGYKTYVESLLEVVDLEKQMLLHPELQRFYEHDGEYAALTPDQRKMFHWSGMLLITGEFAFTISPLGRGWMGEDEWDGWPRYIRSYMATNEIFRLAWKINRDVYGRKYRNFVDEIYDEVLSSMKK